MKKDKPTNPDVTPKPSSNIRLVFLGNGFLGSPKSVVLQTDATSYLFNCGECTLRAFQELVNPKAVISDILITQRKWSYLGGVTGFSMSRGSLASSSINIHGPKGIQDVFSLFHQLEMGQKMHGLAARKLNFMASNRQWSDGCVDVDYIALSAKDYPDVISYIVTPNVPDKDFETPIRSLAIIDCTSADQITSLEEQIQEIERRKLYERPNRKLKSNYEERSQTMLDCPLVIVHLTPRAIVEHEQYVSWLKTFSADTHHVFVSSEGKGSPSHSVYRRQTVLNSIHSEIFPMIYGSEKSCISEPLPLCLQDLGNVYLAQPGAKFNFGPNLNFEQSSGNRFTYKDKIERLDNKDLETKEPSTMSDHTQDTEPKPYSRTSSEFPQILFLGTNSSFPKKLRNVSGILVRISQSATAILDCGEGTSAQLQRFYVDDLREILSTLKFIYISHFHPDHHLGLTRILTLRRHLLGEDAPPLPLLANERMLSWLVKFHVAFEPVMQLIIPLSLQPIWEAGLPQHYLEDFGLSELRSCRVLHSAQASGISMTMMDGWKMTYSGDTRPCDDLVRMGMDSDLLIHEATHCASGATNGKSDAEFLAFDERHSTLLEAVNVADAMRAKLVMLTHFNSRSQSSSVPILPKDTERLARAGIAFDFCLIKPKKDTYNIPLLIPLIQKTFHKKLKSDKEITGLDNVMDDGQAIYSVGKQEKKFMNRK